MLRKYDNFFNDETTYVHGTTAVARVNHGQRTIEIPKQIPDEIAQSLHQIIMQHHDYNVKELKSNES